MQRKNDSAPQEKQKPPEAVQEEDIQLEEDDYALLAEFGDRIDFLTGATPLQHESSATPRKRYAPFDSLRGVHLLVLFLVFDPSLP